MKFIKCCCGDNLGSLHIVTTFNVDHSLKEKTNTNFELLAKMAKAHEAGDILYHRNCIRLVREIPDDTDIGITREAPYSDILLQIRRTQEQGRHGLCSAPGIMLEVQ